MTGESKNRVWGGAVLLVLLLSLWYGLGHGTQEKAMRNMDEINRRLASDAVSRYGIAKRHGSPMDICLQAKLAAATYLQVKDESNYAIWKDTERADCAKAGIPLR